MNGESINFPGEDQTFDCVWICEALSHFSNKPAFFAHAFRLLAPGGKLVLADWFSADKIKTDEEKETIKAIEYGMLLPKLETKQTYIRMMCEAGFELVYMDDVSQQVSPTWDISASLIVNPALWKLAFSHGSDFLNFLRSFSAMRKGYSSHVFRYALMVAEKI